jgi:hypothetical protein
MKYNLSDKIIAYLTLISGLVISAVAVWYSVAGLVSIFAAAAVPIIIMGVALEVSKLIATVWLKLNWTKAPITIRVYLISAIAILMLITSMGIFGFLSKAHSDAGLVSGDVQAKISVYDEKIKTERENIDAARKALSQMDAQVNERLSRSTDDRGAERAVQIRRQQQAERTRLQNDISRSQGAIAKLNEERAPIAAEVRKVEAEVGPIKYIAKLIYSDEPDTNTLEKAVTWVIIIIVLVFDPLAVVLLLASQYSFQWFRRAREEEEAQQTPKSISDFVPQPQTLVVEQPDLVAEANAKLAEIEHEPNIEAAIASAEEVKRQEEKSALDEWNSMIAEAEKAAEEEKDNDDHEIIDKAADTEKKAMKAWKLDNPDGSLKVQKKLLAKGVIDQLPWETYLEHKNDLTDEDNEAAVEAAKWAAEQLDAKKKDSDMDRTRRTETDQEIQRDLGYVQNAEQSDDTLWKRVKEAKKDL